MVVAPQEDDLLAGRNGRIQRVDDVRRIPRRTAAPAAPTAAAACIIMQREMSDDEDRFVTSHTVQISSQRRDLIVRIALAAARRAEAVDPIICSFNSFTDLKLLLDRR